MFGGFTPRCLLGGYRAVAIVACRAIQRGFVSESQGFVGDTAAEGVIKGGGAI